MSLFCGCGNSGKNANTGASKSILHLKRPALYILVQKFADDGTKNVINASDFVNGQLPAAFINGKLNHVDPSKRWYPVKDLRGVTNVREAPNVQGFDAGQNNIITSEGLRTVNATTISGNARYKNNLDKLACEGLAFFEVDECGAIGGELEKSNEQILLPHPIAKRTFYTNLVKAQGTDGQTLAIQFEYDQISADARESIIPDNHIESDALDMEGLLNLIPAFSNITTTGFTLELFLEYGGFESAQKQTGLVAADFTLQNITTDAAVSIDTMTETSTKGVYEVTFAAQTSADVLELRQAFTGDKYDKEGFELEVAQVTIP